MCGRYAASRRPRTSSLEFEAVRAEGQPALPADYNVAPTKDVHVVRLEEGARRRGRRPPAGGTASCAPSAGGWCPPGPRTCRSATGCSTPGSSRSPRSRPSGRRRASRRCLVPADGWYEWAKRLDGPAKQPYFVTPQDGSVLAFAGLWEVWGRGEDRLYTCTVVTVAGRRRAHRDPRADAAGAAPRPLGRLARPGPGGRRGARPSPTPPEVVETLELRPVSTAVNNVANNGPELLARAEAVSAPADQPALF